MQGIVIVNKPKGWTSFDVVNKIKRIFNTSKVGHLGTLDPMAEGVLPVAIGKATKLFDYYLNKTKSYVAEFEFGYETDTLDSEGKAINKSDVIPTISQINIMVGKLTGQIMQTPPKYSAIKINGKRAYSLARQNIEFEPTPKQVEIFKLNCTKQIQPNKFEFEIECSSGTYIRSIARDLAQLLGTYATMTKLTRIRSGNFYLNESKTITELELDPSKGILALERVLGDLPQIQVKEDKLPLLINGVQIKISNKSNQFSTIYVGDKLFGLGTVVDGKLVVKVRLYEGE